MPKKPSSKDSVVSLVLRIVNNPTLDEMRIQRSYEKLWSPLNISMDHADRTGETDFPVLPKNPQYIKSCKSPWRKM
ncbi:hypothetical protein Tco_1145511 [Tanacetum coccineum]